MTVVLAAKKPALPSQEYILFDLKIETKIMCY